MFDELVKKKEKEKGVSERTNSTMAEIDDGPNGACTLHKGSTTNVNFIKTYLYVIHSFFYKT